MSAAPAREEEQLKAYEEQLSRMQSIDIALQAAASLLNIGGMRLGLSAGASERRDLEQVRDAIDGVRALMPIIERRLPAEETGRLRDALSQLQMAYAQLVRETATATAGAGAHDARGPSEPASGGAQQPGAGGILQGFQPAAQSIHQAETRRPVGELAADLIRKNVIDNVRHRPVGRDPL